jgi:hypothetical protein
MSTRKSPIAAGRANVLGAMCAEADNQIRWALEALEKGDIKSARERLRDASERCDIVRNECYWEPEM